MRIAFVNPILPRSNGLFWADAFRKKATHFMHVQNSVWNLDQVCRWQPDHVHFNSAAQPVQKWAPIDKIKRLRQILGNTVITTYFCDAKKSFKHRIQLNKIVDGAFCSFSNNAGTHWMPVPAPVRFWTVERAQNPKYLIVFVGNVYRNMIKRQGFEYTRVQTIKAVAKRYELTLVGGGWQREYGLKHLPPTKTYGQTREYYRNAKIGLNAMNDGYRDLERCWSNRLTHMMLAGLPCFTPWMPKLETVFKDGENIVIYHTDSELLRKLDFYLQRPAMLQEIGRRGQLKMRQLADIDRSVDRILGVKRKA